MEDRRLLYYPKLEDFWCLFTRKRGRLTSGRLGNVTLATPPKEGKVRMITGKEKKAMSNAIFPPWPPPENSVGGVSG